MRSTCNVYTKAISLQTRYGRMPKNTCTGLESTLTLRTTQRDARNVSSSLRPAKEPLQPHDIPEGPWRKLGMDYFHFNGNSYVLICDYFSKFPFMYKAKTSFWSLRDHLIELFSIEGYPDEIVSDNGPPFNSKEFAKFLSGLGIKHTT